MDTSYECVVVGGGAAGLSAAMVLGRARRKTLVVDAGQQSNRPDKGIGGLLGNNGTPPSEFYEKAAAEVDEYPSVDRISGSVVKAARDDEGFYLATELGAEYMAGNVILATGMKYEYPDIPGIAELWGRDAFHCPFCHGWEARDGNIAVITQSTPDLMRARLIQLWSDRVTVLTNGSAIEDPEQAADLEAARIPIVDKEIDRLVVADESLEAIRFSDGTEVDYDSVMVPVTMRHRTDLAAQLGAETNEGNPMIIDAVKVDFLQHTSVPGLSAAGDVSTQGAPSVAAAIAEGHRAAAGIVHDLAFKD